MQIVRSAAWSSVMLAAVIASSSLSAQVRNKLEPGTYTVDPAHSKAEFKVSHLVISSVEGSFRNFTGAIEVGTPFEQSKLQAEADIASIDTGVKDRDEHLKSPDFFDAANHPKMTFKSTAISGKPESFKMTGDLTIRGTTKQVVFDGEYVGSLKDMAGKERAVFKATAKVDRKAFGLAWNKVIEAGPVVGDEVEIRLSVEAQKKDEPPAAK